MQPSSSPSCSDRYCCPMKAMKMASKIATSTGICGFRCVLMPVCVAHAPATLPGDRCVSWSCVLGSTPRQRRWFMGTAMKCGNFQRAALRATLFSGVVNLLMLAGPLYRHPSSSSRRKKLASQPRDHAVSAAPIRTTTRRMPPACCARAANGHATAAPPSSVMKSRRPMPDMGGPSLRDCRTLSLPPAGPAGPWGRPEMF